MNWEPKNIEIITEQNHDSFFINHQSILRAAYNFGFKNSDDPATKNGVVIIDKKKNQVIYGANRFPKGVENKLERFKRPLKYSYIEHAERNGIFTAVREGISLKGFTIYTPWLPCCECSRAIINSGIDQLISHKTVNQKTPERWQESLERSIEMLKEANIDMKLYQGKIGNAKAIFDGKIWHP